ncbi:MAG: prolyl oligopeptidase family serine peptidase [Cellulophaga sp.]|nr:prolyl oligopeptidase family serine peptidase [Cellulophaga sp.]
MKTIFTTILLLTSLCVFSQKKVLDHSDLDLWNSIENEQISPDGSHVLYGVQQGEKDQTLHLKSSKGNSIFEYARGEKGSFTYDSNFVLFTIKAWTDSITVLKQRKVKKDKMPKDSLGIYDLSRKSLTKIGNIKSYKIPEKWSGYVAYYLEDIKPEKDKKEVSDTTKIQKSDDKKKVKKVSKENGYHLVLRNLMTQQQDTFKFVTNFTFAEKGKFLAYTSTGDEKDSASSVVVMNLDKNEKKSIYKADKAKYYQLAFSESGKNLGFIVDTDTTKIQVRPNELYYWKDGNAKAEKLVSNSTSPKDYLVSSYGNIEFSKDESKLFFGLATQPIMKDTLLTDDQIVNVEVWTYDEPQLYTVQELQVKNDTIKSYKTVIDLKNKNKLIQLGTTQFPATELGNEGNADFALVSTSEPYDLESQWTGNSAKNFAIVNTKTGETSQALTKFTSADLSPDAKYIYGYNLIDSLWFTYNVSTKSYKTLTKGMQFYDELNDSPAYPSSYGSPGFTKDDKWLILYDRFDIFKFNPETGANIKLTNGRVTNTRYRYVKTDKEERFLDEKTNWLLSTFNETTKEAGFVSFNPTSEKITPLISGAYRYSNPIKASLSTELLYTQESFKEFPDLRVADANFKNSILISNANPQQSNYNWGTVELVNWTSLDGIELTGLLVKPENFDPSKKYPMLVNFYERSSDGLHSHRAPVAGRSSINYSFYTSRGYVIFVPDIQYRIGYPGESAFNCVIPGVTSLIEKGFIDKDNIGVQGHSWGGYQIAYLVTKTDIFKAAESGAPVPNMISAYGGIRWWTGLSRQFQYEHTQSRIGGTPWEYPQRYVENSPIFNIDKINTPLLIMHNDADGHVPWYQGIEFFVSLRRLQKPSWFLNYNGEPHWPLKLQNRKDFNMRMAQFFDYYLKGEAMPVWMDRGVPAAEKGINQGLELMKE